MCCLLVLDTNRHSQRALRARTERHQQRHQLLQSSLRETEGSRDGGELASHDVLGQNRRAQDAVKEELEADQRVREIQKVLFLYFFSKNRKSRPDSLGAESGDRFVRLRKKNSVVKRLKS
jgi:hypothetical protein